MDTSKWLGPFGLYVHIPFCEHLCRYCDFVKSVNFSEGLVRRYFENLSAHLGAWLESTLWADSIKEKKLATVNFGGGTPGLFGFEYEPIFFRLYPVLQDRAEVSIEINPRNATADNLQVWKSLGVNRVSIGVQSFNEAGIRFLTRDHTHEEAIDSIVRVMSEIPNINVDLIYGWPGQDLDIWKNDLQQAVSLGVKHLSLYNLTFEQSTPLGIALKRGEFDRQPDDLLAGYYDAAMEILDAAGFCHDEVSNWSKPGFTCDHNWLYWRGRNFIGIGCGAHGFLPGPSPIGTRYSYPLGPKQFIERTSIPKFTLESSLATDLANAGLVVENRSNESWLIEYVGCALRSAHGINIPHAEAITGMTFTPNRFVKRAIEEGSLTLGSNGFLVLCKREWFRENAWCLEILSSFC